MDRTLLKSKLDDLAYAIENVGGIMFGFSFEDPATLKEVNNHEKDLGREIPSSFKKACLHFSQRVSYLGEVNGSIEGFEEVQVFWYLRFLDYEFFEVEPHASKTSIQTFLNKHHNLDVLDGFFHIHNCMNGDVIFMSEISEEVFCLNYRTYEIIKVGDDFIDYILKKIELFGLTLDYETFQHFSTNMEVDTNCPNAEHIKNYLSLS